MEDLGSNEIDLLAGITRLIVNEAFVPLNQLKWRKGENGSEYLSLNEIAEQLSTPGVIYVWVESGLSGKIFLWNNYGDGKWHNHGTTRGYA